ncbi:PREDICTED: uncharacterized protein LOC108377847 [Rhagoletis zephyria]|uniref:uncharacterized protein LOC108377847 n=1 Tax=Rhagoletis zephyria TaxID=28612 RepID=UPI0008118E21|nr:PREDICTED: uncharacterized protein LOC108377847 [Rhagoletis zephyria]
MKLVLVSTLLLIGGVLALQDSVEVSTPKPDINGQSFGDTEQKPIGLGNIQPNPFGSVYPNPTLPLFPLTPQFNPGACLAPIGLGLSNLFNQAKALLPLERIENIVRAAAQDPEVHAFYKLVQTPEYRQRSASFRGSREYRVFRDLACYKLNFDLRLYIDFKRNLLPLSALKEPPRIDTEQLPQGRPGLRGLLEDIRDALPRQRLRDLFERLLVTDSYLTRAVQVKQGYEFKIISELVQRNPDFQYLRRAELEVGLPLEEWQKLMHIALGWREDLL